MSDLDLLNNSGRKQIKAFDGMAVTADVWNEAHDYHRNALALHTAFSHAPGVLYGLEVIAGNPPDCQVYVQPGIAIDQEGRTVVVPEQRAYDMRTIGGSIYLFLMQAISQPRNAPSLGAEDAPRYVYSEYTLQAASQLPSTPYVELARVNRQSAITPIRTAADGDHPGVDEIDLRYRRQVGPSALPIVSIAVSYVGGMGTPGSSAAGNGQPAVASLASASGLSSHAAGITLLGRGLRASGRAQVCVDDNVQIDGRLASYTLLYLVGREAFQLPADQMRVLYEFVRQGGSILYESCRDAPLTAEPAGDASFLELMNAMGLRMEAPALNHPIFQEPHLFAAPPDGFETQAPGRFLLREGAMFSSYDYGCLWQGQRRGRLAKREEIRSALEWGENLVMYACRRRGR